MRVLARWVCPVATAPIRDGWVHIEGGRIVAVGGPGACTDGPSRDLGNVVLMPGVVNAHTHLELSWLRGRVPPAATFVDWIKTLFVTRGGRRERIDDPAVTGPARQAAAEMHAFGTAAVGDISNSLATIESIRAAGLRGIVFHELLGFNVPHGEPVAKTRALREAAARFGGDAVRVSVAPHAPYSVSPEMFRAIRDEVDRSAVPITSVHVAESDSEIRFLRDGSGPWPGILQWVGSTRDDWTPPGQGPVEYLDSLGMLDERTLVVHGVHLDDAALAQLRRIGATLVTCPRSNQWVGVGVPPVARFYASGVPVAIGTDSLASVDDLNIFAELQAMRWLAPHVPARRLLESATLVGARALGLDAELGTIEAGKRAALIAITLRADAGGAHASASDHESTAIEEYLVSGIRSEQIAWVTS
jgi:cytosine/adenosine deaminase-related metal-dependent hydrolase